jgi:hypothetical protein
MNAAACTLLLPFLAATLPLSAITETEAVPAGVFDRNELRELTDDKGRVIRARITHLSMDEVSILREDGRDFRVSISLFAKEDQDYFELWRLADILNSAEHFDISVTRFTEGRDKMITQVAQVDEARMGYIITLRNRSPVSLRELELEYRVFKLARLPSEEDEEHFFVKEGAETIEVLPAGQSFEVRSQTIGISETRLQDGLVYLDDSSDRQREELGGIWIRISKEGQLLAEMSRPARLKEQERW